MHVRELQFDSWNTAESKGFHKARLNQLPEISEVWTALMLITSEIAEAAEVLRDVDNVEKLKDITWEFKDLPAGEWEWRDGQYFCDGRPTHINGKGELHFTMRAGAPPKIEEGAGTFIAQGKPNGFASELADAVIRIADECETLGIDLEHVLELKANYNKTRPFLHGRKA